MWKAVQVQEHFEAAKKLGFVKNDVAKYIRDSINLSEFSVQSFVIKKINEYGLKMDTHKPIVAFGKSSSFVHYFPNRKNNRKLKKDTLILLDIWARLNKAKAPYADMTWMFYYGNKAPEKLENYFKIVLNARDLALSKLKINLKKGEPVIGREMNILVKNYFGKLEKNFKHSLGHSLGTVSPHGTYAGFHRRNIKPIALGLAYTIEPGLYFTNKFGFRSEIDVFVDKFGNVTVTTLKQNKLEIIKKF